jgi:hypothetical protein
MPYIFDCESYKYDKFLYLIIHLYRNQNCSDNKVQIGIMTIKQNYNHAFEQNQVIIIRSITCQVVGNIFPKKNELKVGLHTKF